ncbi:hypothetical protein FHR83_007438 [Actinoplanes campanulatus]|uniref:Chaplin domain-containing protein n=1 Tax=Actinoplanes campanulatus TaxID=113559 RepID=A0A7W5FIJ9_9ACTN|nr:chaplin [Actinoplanes campanulatus]MBB3099729.1 hypothetical protein [Actinoplanes campanulatus]GGN25482.1 hypothetical protein GCM10010109_41780 [Actinoplanes campanulatus]GID39411.1 hypothetical protein Aca09nite_59170 [Actinoplanes campanulatus]
MKKTWVRKTLSVGVLAAGALLLAPAAVAQADVDQATFNNFGAANGTQVAMPITVPVNLVGNSVGALGSAQAVGAGANKVENAGGRTKQRSFNNYGALNGTQVAVPVNVPVNVTGNAAAVAGHATAKGVSANQVESARTPENIWGGGPGGGSSPDQLSYNNYGALNGNQVSVPINIPINACGNALALIGSATANGICANQIGPTYRMAHPQESKKAGKRTESATAAGGGSGDQVTTGNYGLLNGNQVSVPINIPINACGNAIGVLGFASANGICANSIGGGQPISFDRGNGHPGGGQNPGGGFPGGGFPGGGVLPGGGGVLPGGVLPGDDYPGGFYPGDLDEGPDYGILPVHNYVPYYPVPDYILDDCDEFLGDLGPDGPRDYYPGDREPRFRGNGIVKGDGNQWAPGDDIRGDQGVKGPKGVKGGKANAGYDKGGNRGDDFPADTKDDFENPADDNDVSPDKYGKGNGGRENENSPVSALTKDLGGVGSGNFGGLDLLDTLR